MRKRVVITGIGVVSPTGVTTEAFWQNCLSGNVNVSPIPRNWQKYHSYNSTVWSPVPELDYSSYGITQKECRKLDKLQLLVLAAADQAVKAAGLKCSIKDKRKNNFTLENIVPGRCGVYIGTSIGGVDTISSCFCYHRIKPLSLLADQMREGLKNGRDDKELYAALDQTHSFINERMPDYFNPFAISMVIPNTCSAIIGIKYSLTGSNNTISCACASGTIALGRAFEEIRSGNLDLALSGGAEYLNDGVGMTFRAFDTAGTLVGNHIDPMKANRPFDRGRSGFLFSEGGSAVLVLEEMEHAIKRGAKILAEMSAFGQSFDGFSVMRIEPEGKEIKRMVIDALKQARMLPGDIDYINAHGTGTEINDAAEASVIEDIFGNHVLVNSTKSLIGHTLGASGAIEAAVAVLSILNKTTHVCKNLEEPVSGLNFVRRVDEYPIRRVLSQSFAFGGHNAALIFEQFHQ
ncbi:MAG: beta-ketoacyl-[acyl-carrier-protein] synthase family protein [Planctomycetota bacterium]|jgi:3-oxoacyl-[acyl-carrier-protein] synthase II